MLRSNAHISHSKLSLSLHKNILNILSLTPVLKDWYAFVKSYINATSWHLQRRLTVRMSANALGTF